MSRLVPQQDQMESMRTHAADFHHRVTELFESLDAEEGITLKQILYNTLNDSGAFAGMMIGQLGKVLERNHNICAGCGVNHEEELQQMNIPKEPLVVEPEETQEVIVENPNEFTDEQRANMAKYHLDDAWREDPDRARLIGFICTGIDGGPRGGCGMIYPSIEDRMLRNPEECTGCFTKAAHG